LKRISLAIAFAALAITAAAQEKQVTVADFVGTWNIELMSHQIALFVDLIALNKPEVMVRTAGDKFDADGNLVDEETRTRVRKLVDALVAWTRRLQVPASTSEEELVELARASEKVRSHLNGGEPRKTIVVPGKLVNFVV